MRRPGAADGGVDAELAFACAVEPASWALGNAITLGRTSSRRVPEEDDDGSEEREASLVRRQTWGDALHVMAPWEVVGRTSALGSLASWSGADDLHAPGMGHWSFAAP